MRKHHGHNITTLVGIGWMESKNDLELFREYASALVAPGSSSHSGSGSSTQRLKTATSWFESMRKSAISFPFFLQILRSSEFFDYEHLLASQSMLWICKRSAHLDTPWLHDLLTLLFPSHSSHGHSHSPSPTHLQQSSILTNLYSSIAALMLRLFPFPSQQSLQDLFQFTQWNSSESFLQILSQIPELCVSPELYHGTKEDIQQNLIMKSSSLFHEISFVSSFLDSLITQSADADELILQFLMTSHPSGQKTQLLSIFSLVIDWLSISKHLACEYQAVVICQHADLILSSRWLQLLDRCFQYLSQPDLGISLTERQNELLQISSEVNHITYTVGPCFNIHAGLVQSSASKVALIRSPSQIIFNGCRSPSLFFIFF